MYPSFSPDDLKPASPEPRDPETADRIAIFFSNHQFSVIYACLSLLRVRFRGIMIMPLFIFNS